MTPGVIHVIGVALGITSMTILVATHAVPSDVGVPIIAGLAASVATAGAIAVGKPSAS